MFSFAAIQLTSSRLKNIVCESFPNNLHQTFLRNLFSWTWITISTRTRSTWRQAAMISSICFLWTRCIRFRAWSRWGCRSGWTRSRWGRFWWTWTWCSARRSCRRTARSKGWRRFRPGAATGFPCRGHFRWVYGISRLLISFCEAKAL